MRRIFGEAGLQAKFREAGYVQVPMLSTEETAHILSRLPTLHPQDNYTPTGRDGFEHKYPLTTVSSIWSANNDSDKARVAIQIACVPAEVQPVFFFFDPRQLDRFELAEAGQEFYLAPDISDLTQRQPHWRSLGFVNS